jgi:hypothetical protein
MIRDDEPIPEDVLQLAMQMAKSRQHHPRDIAARTGLSEARVARMMPSLTYDGKRPAARPTPRRVR